jgi:hypothetical protein
VVDCTFQTTKNGGVQSNLRRMMRGTKPSLDENTTVAVPESVCSFAQLWRTLNVGRASRASSAVLSITKTTETPCSCLYSIAACLMTSSVTDVPLRTSLGTLGRPVTSVAQQIP